MNKTVLQNIIARGKEPSTWAAMAAGLGGLGLLLPSSWVQVATAFGTGACMLAGILMPEKQQ